MVRGLSSSSCGGDLNSLPFFSAFGYLCSIAHGARNISAPKSLGIFPDIEIFSAYFITCGLLLWLLRQILLSLGENIIRSQGAQYMDDIHAISYDVA